MNPRRIKVLVAILIAVGGLALGVVTVVSRAAPEPGPSVKQLAAVASAPTISAAEAATVRAPRQGMPTEPAAGAPITAHATSTVAGQVWKIVSYRAKSGALCAGVTWPGEGQEMGCATLDEWFARGPVAVSLGARQAHGQPTDWQNIVLSGLVDLSRVEKLVLVSTDCSTREVRLDAGGFFLDVTSPGAIARGIWPYRLVGEAADGHAVQRFDVEYEAPDTAEARAAGIRAPAPGAACA
jgi:hypothetical protein